MVSGSRSGRISSAIRAQRARPLHDSPQNAYLAIQCCGPDFLFCAPCPVVDDLLRGDRFQRCLLEVGAQLYEQLFFLGLARGSEFQFPGFLVVICRLPERLACQRGRALRYFAFHRLPYELFFLGLRFSPILGSKRLSKALPVHNEVAVPRLTALYECHFWLPFWQVPLPGDRGSFGPFSIRACRPSVAQGIPPLAHRVSFGSYSHSIFGVPLRRKTTSYIPRTGGHDGSQACIQGGKQLRQFLTCR